MANEYVVSQVNAEVLSVSTAPARVSALNLEILNRATAPARISQLSIEVLRGLVNVSSTVAVRRRAPVL